MFEFRKVTPEEVMDHPEAYLFHEPEVGMGIDPARILGYIEVKAQEATA